MDKPLTIVLLISPSIAVLFGFLSDVDIASALSTLCLLLSIILFSYYINLNGIIKEEFVSEELSMTEAQIVGTLSSFHLLTMISLSLFSLFTRFYLLNFLFLDLSLAFFFFGLFLLCFFLSENLKKKINTRVGMVDIPNLEAFQLRSGLLFLILGLGGTLFFSLGILITVAFTLKEKNKHLIFDVFVLKISVLLLALNLIGWIICAFTYWHVLFFEYLMVMGILYPFVNGFIMFLLHVRLNKEGLEEITTRSWKILIFQRIIVLFIGLSFFPLSLLFIYLLLLVFPTGWILLLNIVITLIMLGTSILSLLMAKAFKAVPIKIGLFLACNSFTLLAWAVFSSSLGFSLNPSHYSYSFLFYILGALVLFYNSFLRNYRFLDQH